MVKVHGGGGHGKYSRKMQQKYEHEQKIKERQKRAEEKNVRKFSAQAERVIKEIVVLGEKNVVPIANKAKKTN
jgi:hypothetical protein